MEIPRKQQTTIEYNGPKGPEAHCIDNPKTKLRLTKRGKGAVAVASVVALSASIFGCEAANFDSNRIDGEGAPSYQRYIDEYSGNRDYELHIGGNNVLVLEDGAKFRPGHFIDDKPNDQKVHTDGDQALVNSDFFVTYHGDEYNGDWIGVPEDSINRDPVLEGFKDELLFGDGLLWVNAELASLETNEPDETNP